MATIGNVTAYVDLDELLDLAERVDAGPSDAIHLTFALRYYGVSIECGTPEDVVNAVKFALDHRQKIRPSRGQAGSQT